MSAAALVALLPQPPGARAASLSTGVSHSLVLLDDGSVYSWGANQSGQLGKGDTVDAAAPLPIALPLDASTNGAAGRAVVAGGHSSAVIHGDAVGSLVPPRPATLSLAEVRMLVGGKQW